MRQTGTTSGHAMASHRVRSDSECVHHCVALSPGEIALLRNLDECGGAIRRPGLFSGSFPAGGGHQCDSVDDFSAPILSLVTTIVSRITGSSFRVILMFVA